MRSIPPGFECIDFPQADQLDPSLDQDEEWVSVTIDGRIRKLRLHDYQDLYSVPGLYETLIYDRLECCSPTEVAILLKQALGEEGRDIADLRVLDVGAGNGMMGDELDARGAEHIVGIDIVPAAREATLRDRPGVYQKYLISDLTDLPEADERFLRQQSFNCLTVVGALGFGDIPCPAFTKSMDLLATNGLVAFNLKEGLFHGENRAEFSRFIEELCRADVLRIETYRRYRHRVSVAGEPIFYVAVVATKLRDLPDDVMQNRFVSDDA